MPYKDPQSKEAKESQKRRNKKYYEKNKEAIMAYKKENGLEYRKEYYKKNKDKMKKQSTVARRLRDFGVTPSEYDDMYDKQDGKCWICRKKEIECQQKSLCVDHNHDTGKVRGLLCHDCNVGLGRFKDNVNSLKRAIEYLNNNN